MSSNIDKFVQEKARLLWLTRLESAKEAAQKVLSAIRCGNSVDMRELYRAFAIRIRKEDGDFAWKALTGGTSEYGMQKGMLEHLIWTLIEVRNSYALKHVVERPFRQSINGEQSFQQAVLDATEEQILEDMLRKVDDESPEDTVTITGKNVKVTWEDEEG